MVNIEKNNDLVEIEVNSGDKNQLQFKVLGKIRDSHFKIDKVSDVLNDLFSDDEDYSCYDIDDLVTWIRVACCDLEEITLEVLFVLDDGSKYLVRFNDGKLLSYKNVGLTSNGIKFNFGYDVYSGLSMSTDYDKNLSNVNINELKEIVDYHLDKVSELEGIKIEVMDVYRRENDDEWLDLPRNRVLKKNINNMK